MRHTLHLATFVHHVLELHPLRMVEDVYTTVACYITGCWDLKLSPEDHQFLQNLCEPYLAYAHIHHLPQGIYALKNGDQNA